MGGHFGFWAHIWARGQAFWLSGRAFGHLGVHLGIRKGILVSGRTFGLAGDHLVPGRTFGQAGGHFIAQARVLARGRAF